MPKTIEENIFFLNLIHKVDLGINRHQVHKVKRNRFARLSNYDYFVEKDRSEISAQSFSEIIVIDKIYQSSSDENNKDQ